MQGDHYTVHIEIHRIAQEPTNPGATVQCRCRAGIDRCHHAKPETKRVDTQIVNVTARANGDNDNALRDAIDKAIAHLHCERPINPQPVDIAERLGYPQ